MAALILRAGKLQEAGRLISPVPNLIFKAPA